MKKNIFFLIPILIFGVFMLLSNRLFLSGGIDPTTFIMMGIALVLILMLARPKTAAKKAPADVAEEVMGDYAKDAFADDPQLNAKFQAALKDYGSNCPKAALSKLAKLAPQCRNDKETYAVAMATALCHVSQHNYAEAIPEYNRAVVLNPTAALAITIGSCNQRLGNLKEAKDSYEFALDLEPENVDARSSLATVYVARGKYESALEQAMLALQLNEKHASSLATAAICYGMLDDSLLYKHYMNLASENGYSEEKIKNTVSALKKRK